MNFEELKSNLNTLNRESRIDELEKIKVKIEQIDFDFGDYYDNTDTIIKMISNVIDKRIEELEEEIACDISYNKKNKENKE